MKKSNFFLTGIAFATLNFHLFTLNCTAQYTKLLDFAGENGSKPFGSLISDGTFLYGMTSFGGTGTACYGGCGVIFKIKPDGSGYSKLLDFAGISNGSMPFGSLISDGTFLYGMTAVGGANNLGTIFKIKPDGTRYAKLLDFTGNANGNIPMGSLISDETFLYGMTQEGGANSLGTIFKIKHDGTGYSKLLDFSGTPDGSSPRGSLVFDGTFLYGMTLGGGTGHCTNGCGTIFKIKPDGTGYFKLLDFEGAANGSSPDGALIFDGTFLYGMTQVGGTNNDGVIFKIKTDGTEYFRLLDFESTTNGQYPHGDLISDGIFLYGMTMQGGKGNCSHGCEVNFKIKPDGTGYSPLQDFEGTNGQYSDGDLISDKNCFYGMSLQGGINNGGVIFKYGLKTDIAENSTEIDFSVYPNPSNGILFLNLNPSANTQDKSGKGTVIVCNILGEKIYQSAIHNPQSEIDLSNQPTGIYFLKVKTEQGVVSKKISLNK
ncbi:MAG: choice-of-anchor tandem repeat GloVer-containing protein [Bacteroidota bacterium]